MSSHPLVVDCRKERFDVYIGRPRSKAGAPAISEHYGNPFSHLRYSTAAVQVATVGEAVARFRTWLRGESDTNLDQTRRQWILDHLMELEGKRLGCYGCDPCHGEVYEELIEERKNPISC